MYSKILERLTDLEQKLANVHRIGTIETVDYETATATVRFSDDHVSGKLPIATHRAGGDVDWWVPEVGEQVLVYSPNGDLDRAFIGLDRLYQTAHPAPENIETKRTTTYADGAVISYDRENSILSAELPAGATVQLTADGGISFVGDFSVDGNITSTGDVTATGEISDTDGELSRLRTNYNSHKHVGNMGSPTSPTDKLDQ